MKDLKKQHLSLYKGSVKGAWREGSFTVDSKRHVKEGFGNRLSFSLQGLHEGNLEGGLLH